MIKQYVAQFFCYLTIILLSSNIAFSAIPFSHQHKSKSENHVKTFSLASDLHQSALVTEKDPFEDLISVFLKPDFAQLVWVNPSFDLLQPNFLELSGSKYVQIPIWLLFRTIIQ